MDQYRWSPATAPWRLGGVQHVDTAKLPADVLHCNNSNYMGSRTEVKTFLLRCNKNTENLFFSKD
jgi:hypothetical protein